VEGHYIGIQAVLLQLEGRQKAVWMVTPAITTAEFFARNRIDLSAAHLLVLGELLGQLWVEFG